MYKYLISFIVFVLFIAVCIGNCNDSNDYEDNDMDVKREEAETLENQEERQKRGKIDTIDTTNKSTSEYHSTALEIPRMTKSVSEQILEKMGYTVSYNNETKNANWVAWHLTKERTLGSANRDGIPYMVDQEVRGPRQELDDWYNLDLPLDHGHICPAADNKWSQEAMEQTFLLTNMCPQNHNLNSGDWEELESRCRGWARHYGDVYIAAGPIIDTENKNVIGNNVAVPDAFFKVILCMKGKHPKALGFIYPNVASNHKMSYYVHTVDDVEEKTGIDFFCNLPDSIETAVESVSNLHNW